MTREKSMYERALDALPDGVLLVNGDRRVIYSNAAFGKIWELPAALCATGDDRAMVQAAMQKLVDPESFAREVERHHGSTRFWDDELHFLDGRIISRRSLPFHEGGDPNCRIWIFTDVTEARNAYVDPLTKLRNRLAFSREFPPFVEEEGCDRVRSVAILDVDNFKKYNDSYGHAAGDELLRRLGGVVTANLRSDDLAFRVGGEEFVIAVRTAHRGHAAELFERVRAKVATMGCVHAANDTHGVATVSLGYTSFIGPHIADRVFRVADQALYQAKNAGRNRVVLAEAV